MNDESEHVPDQEARGILSFAGLSSHGMNPCNHLISCLCLSLTRVQTRASAVCGVNSCKCGWMDE